MGDVIGSIKQQFSLDGTLGLSLDGGVLPSSQPSALIRDGDRLASVEEVALRA